MHEASESKGCKLFKVFFFKSRKFCYWKLLLTHSGLVVRHQCLVLETVSFFVSPSWQRETPPALHVLYSLQDVGILNLHPDWMGRHSKQTSRILWSNVLVFVQGWALTLESWICALSSPIFHWLFEIGEAHDVDSFEELSGANISFPNFSVHPQDSLLFFSHVIQLHAYFLGLV